jgi:hypothetical protein
MRRMEIPPSPPPPESMGESTEPEETGSWIPAGIKSGFMKMYAGDKGRQYQPDPSAPRRRYTADARADYHPFGCHRPNRMARRPTVKSAWSFCHRRQLAGRMNNHWLQLARDFGRLCQPK